MAHPVARNVRIEEDLVDQLFNSTRNGWLGCSCCWPLWQGRETEPMIPKISQEV